MFKRYGIKTGEKANVLTSKGYASSMVPWEAHSYLENIESSIVTRNPRTLQENMPLECKTNPSGWNVWSSVRTFIYYRTSREQFVSKFVLWKANYNDFRHPAAIQVDNRVLDLHPPLKPCTFWMKFWNPSGFKPYLATVYILYSSHLDTVRRVIFLFGLLKIYQFYTKFSRQTQLKIG